MTATASKLQMKVTPGDIDPPIWRRLVVSGSATLAELHQALQIAMGWENCHLHQFEIGGVVFGTADDEDVDEGDVDESTASVAEAFANAGRGTYLYDFGDSWTHELVVEEGGTIEDFVGLARCTDGHRPAPPEDCGGPPGYAALADAFDPQAFDIDAVNIRLAKLR